MDTQYPPKRAPPHYLPPPPPDSLNPPPVEPYLPPTNTAVHKTIVKHVKVSTLMSEIDTNHNDFPFLLCLDSVSSGQIREN